MPKLPLSSRRCLLVALTVLLSWAGVGCQTAPPSPRITPPHQDTATSDAKDRAGRITPPHNPSRPDPKDAPRPPRRPRHPRVEAVPADTSITAPHQ